MQAKNINKVRLPNFIKPSFYQLSIRPDMESFTFSGSEIVHVEIGKSVKQISLHCKTIEILDGFWQFSKNKKATKIEIAKISYDTKSETVTLKFQKEIPKGAGELHLNFRGIITEDLSGFYRSKYSHKGKVQHIITTQFEPTDARKAFPCFDEPSHKAVFELTLEVPNHLTAISNTVESSVQTISPTPEGVDHNSNYKVVKFAPTPKMSTYLLAYMVGEFESVESKTKNGVTIRVFTTPGKSKQTKFALEVAKKSLDFLEEYFAIPYPLPVLDLIAIPDFAAGAMENWGAVTFRESALLVEEMHTPFSNKQQVAETIAHELVHQWFGNLVTMEWWTHLWLNESFASFMSYIVLDSIFPEWKIWTRFVLHDHNTALELDSLRSTHPIEVEVHHPSEIDEIFDAISYDKGASVLRMLQNYIGPENFRDGLRHYLKSQSYKNTSSIHLWESFEKISGKPIRKFMKNWTEKEGYPFLAIVENTSKTSNSKIDVIQERFTLEKTKDNTTWQIPFQNESLTNNLLTKEKSVVTIPNDLPYFKANVSETGFYRTLYSPSLLAKLYEPIRTQELSTVDRFGVIRDLMAMVKSGKVATSAYLEFIKAYQDEDSYIIWTEILSGMSEIYNLYATDSKLKEQLSNYYLAFLKPMANRVGWEVKPKETQMETQLRSIILFHYGSYGNKNTIKKSLQLFKSRNKKTIHPDLKNTVYLLTAKNGHQSISKELRQMYTSSHMQEEQRRIGRAMVTFEKEEIFLKNLDFILSKNVRKQDAPILMFSALSNSQNKEVAWKWLRRNWKTIHEIYREERLIVWVVEALSSFSDIKTRKEIEAFFKKNPVPVANRAIKQVLEQIAIKSKWKETDKKDVKNFLKSIAKSA